MYMSGHEKAGGLNRDILLEIQSVLFKGAKVTEVREGRGATLDPRRLRG